MEEFMRYGGVNALADVVRTGEGEHAVLAVAALGTLARHSGDPVVEAIVAQQLAPWLVRMQGSGDSRAAGAACITVSSIAMVSERFAKEAAEAGTLPAIARLLQSSDDTMQMKTIGALGSMLENPGTAAAAVDAGIVPALSGLILPTDR